MGAEGTHGANIITKSKPKLRARSLTIPVHLGIAYVCVPVCVRFSQSKCPGREKAPALKMGR